MRTLPQMWRPIAGMLLVLGLAACAGQTSPGSRVIASLPPSPASSAIASSSSVSPAQGASDVTSSCVLYVRAVSGIDIRADAYAWWGQAAGRYLRGQLPEPGAVLVLSQTNRLQRGHVAVVRQVLDDRDILVDHSNWVPGQIITGMQVRDVSPDNDWTQLRFLNSSAGAYGSIYPADGFIYQPASTAAVGANTNPGSSQLGSEVAAQ